MLFEYHAKNSDEQLQVGVIEAGSAQEANVRLRAQNLKIIDVQIKKQRKLNRKSIFNEIEVNDFFSKYIYYKSCHLEESQVLELMQKQCSHLVVKKYCHDLKTRMIQGRSLLSTILEVDDYFDQNVKSIMQLGFIKNYSDTEIAKFILSANQNQIEQKSKLVQIEMKIYMILSTLALSIGLLHLYLNLNHEAISMVLPFKLNQVLMHYQFSNIHLTLFYLAIHMIFYYIVRPLYQERLFFIRFFQNTKCHHEHLDFLHHLDLMVKMGGSISQSLNLLGRSGEFSPKNNLSGHRKKRVSHSDLNHRIQLLVQLEVFAENRSEVDLALKCLTCEYSLLLNKDISDLNGIIHGMKSMIIFVLFSILIFGLSLQQARGL